MINESATADEQVRALAAAVRDGEPTPEQREHLGDLLHSLAAAVGLARRDRYPDNDSAVLGYLIATWAPVSSAPPPYAEWAATVRREARGTPRSLSGYPFAEVHRPGATVLGHRRGGLPRRGGVPGGS